MKHLPKAFVIICCIFIASCNNRKNESKQIVEKWLGKEIIFPPNFQCHLYMNDTTQEICKNLLDRPYKVLFYADSTGCSGCRLELAMWQKLIAETDSLIPNQVGFIFFLQPKSMQYINALFELEDFKYPVFIDRQQNLDQLNHLPTKAEYQCFLLNQSNQIMLIGNPCMNSQIWELYKNVLQNSNKNSKK